ncbi:amidase family protein [Streptomyces sp. MA5143a]|uniref:amidase family protein n=1 Tax=Streptomyces sp. MA5143a TaxID=2083010 RepID=UPI000D1B92FF|nr:amidase family protein [Streptomyces sp. MA5143a]
MPSAVGIAAAVRAGDVRAVDVVAECLGRIAAAEPALCAFVEVWAEDALRWAADVDRRVAAGEPLPLAGVPIGVKGRSGLRAAPARALVAAGCVPVGATSVPGRGTPWQTWGLGAGGRTVNPWRRDRTPGGSSAGSAAAVAAGLVPMATGTDGAGSVRIPAAWCGVLGLKITNGRLPTADRTGLAAPGVLTRYAADAAAYWRCVRDENPRRAEPFAGPPTAALGQDADPPGEDTLPDQDANPPGADSLPVQGANPPGADTLPGQGGNLPGADTSPVESPPPGGGTPPAPGTPFPITAVWSADLGFADPDPEPPAVAHAAALRLVDAGLLRLVRPERPVRLDDPAPAWLALRDSSAPDAGTGRTAADALRAGNDRRLAALFGDADLLLTPATPNAPHGHEGPGDRYSTALTWAFNLSGHPALSLPAGFGSDGCPVGLQVVARHGEEDLLLDVALAAEAALA